MEHSSVSGCHKVGPVVALAGDVDAHGEIVDALRARIAASVAEGSATPAEEQVESVGRMLAQSGARSWWRWDQ